MTTKPIAKLYRPAPEQIARDYVPPPLPARYQPREEPAIALTGPLYYKPKPTKPGIRTLTEQDGKRARRQTRPPIRVQGVLKRPPPEPGSWAEALLHNLRREKRWLRAREVAAGTPCPSKKVAQILAPWIASGRVQTLLTPAGGAWYWYRWVPGTAGRRK